MTHFGCPIDSNFNVTVLVGLSNSSNRNNTHCMLYYREGSKAKTGKVLFVIV